MNNKNPPSVKVRDGSDAVLELAGVFHAPGQGLQAAGYSSKGEPVFISSQLARSDNTKAGALLVHTLAATLSPFHVLTKKETAAIENLSRVSESKINLDRLDRASVEKTCQTFCSAILGIVKGSRSALSDMAGEKLYDHWAIMSPAQKSLGIAAFGIQTHKTDEGGTVCDLKIVDGKDQVFTVRDALRLLRAGKNPYGLVQNWDQIVHLQQVFHGEYTPEAMADFAQSHGLLGAGTTDGAVPGVTKDKIAANSGKPTPQYGVGALAVPAGKTPPNGYAKATDVPGGSIIVPQANARSAVGALDGSLLNTEAGDGGISTGAADIYKGWSKDDKKAADKGAEGGSAFIAGLNKLKELNPYLYGAMVSFLTHYGADLLVGSDPLQYFAALGAISLSRLLTGKKEKASEVEGLQLSKNVSTRAAGDFQKLQTELRGVYAHYGISSKADAYQLSNQAYAEDRINESDLVAMHEVFDIIYSATSMEPLHKILNGKERGLEVVHQMKKPARNTMVQGQKQTHKDILNYMTKEAAQKRNAARYAKKQQEAEAEETSPDQESPQEDQGETGEEQPSQEAPAEQPPVETPSGEMGATP